MRPLSGELLDRIRRGGRDLTLLVVRLGALGDVLRTLPPVRLVRAALPHARIFWVLDDRWAVVLEGHTDLDGVIALPRTSWKSMAGSASGWTRLVPSFAAWARGLREPRPQLALDFHGNLRSGIISLLSGAPTRLGYRGHQQKEGNRLFTTHSVPSGPRRTPRMERNLDLVRALGLPDRPLTSGGLSFTAAREQARGIAASLAGAGRPYAILCPGASRKQGYKKPPATLLAAAARQSHARGVAPIVAFGPGEEADADAVGREAPVHRAPPTDLHVLAGLLEGARLFIGGDSGPLHLACAVGCPVLGLYGPTDPVVNAPWGVPHVALHPSGRVYTGVKKRDREAGGFDGLSEDSVRAAVDELVALPARRPAETPAGTTSSDR